MTTFWQHLDPTQQTAYILMATAFGTFVVGCWLMRENR